MKVQNWNSVMQGDSIRNIAATVAYDGSNFAGWQCQPKQSKQRTVEQELRCALSKLHKRDGVKLYASGRTDSGVHASGQVVNFHSDICAGNLSTERFREALNRLLPKDVRILYCWDVAADFHARYSAWARIYEYRIIQSQNCQPQQMKVAWQVYTPRLDISVLNTAVSALLGKHDFSAFTVAGDQAKSKVRHLYAASFYYSGPYIVFRVVGNAFLWHMVRGIVGTVVGLYRQCCKELEAESVLWQEQVYQQRFALRLQMKQYLEGQGLSNGHTGLNAPAHGLSLEQVLYPDQGSSSNRPSALANIWPLGFINRR